MIFMRYYSYNLIVYCIEYVQPVRDGHEGVLQADKKSA